MSAVAACAAALLVPIAVATRPSMRPGLKPGSGPVLVTGATGLVGGHVAAALRDAGFAVRAGVRDPGASKAAFLKDLGCDLARIPDLLSDEGWREAMAGCVGLAHVASPVDVSGKMDEAAMVSQAVEGTERALRFAAGAGTVSRVVVTATMASVCGSQRETDPDHFWSEADTNDAPGSAYSKGKTAAEAKAWELAATHAAKYSVTTVHPAVVFGALLPGQAVSSTMALLGQLLGGAVVPSTFGLCSVKDVAAAHVAGLREDATAGERYLVCSRDQYSTLEIVRMVKDKAPEAGGAIDLDAWLTNEKVRAMAPKKPSTDNRKLCALLGVDDLEAPAAFVAEAARALHARA